MRQFRKSQHKNKLFSEIPLDPPTAHLVTMTTTSSSQQLADELRRCRIEKLREHQLGRRAAAFEKHRFDDDELITEHDIHGLCTRIKRRKGADTEDLRRLSIAFIQSEENIAAFMRVTGAINVIVKEFTGNDRTQQILAAQCLCNLSLGNETCCAKLATFAGSYLMIVMLNINETHLAVSRIQYVTTITYNFMNTFFSPV